MVEKHVVLVTGCAGAVGRPVCLALRSAGHHVRGLDLTPVDGLDSFVCGDVADSAAVAEAMDGVACVVHLAANPHNEPFVERLVQPNVVGLFHVLDQARKQGVRRVILASSMQVCSGVAERPLTPAHAQPRNHYALTKLWAEQMGEMYARCYGLEVVAARIGWLPRNPVECQRLERSGAQSSYLSPRDAGRFFAAAAVSREPGGPVPFAIAFVVGPQDAEAPKIDLTSARLLGYEPRDRYPEGLGFEARQA